MPTPHYLHIIIRVDALDILCAYYEQIKCKQCAQYVCIICKQSGVGCAHYLFDELMCTLFIRTNLLDAIKLSRDPCTLLAKLLAKMYTLCTVLPIMC